MRLSTPRDDAGLRDIHQSDGVIATECVIDGGGPSRAHVGPQTSHPIRSARSADLGDEDRIPIVPIRLTQPDGCGAEKFRRAVDDLEVAHLHRDDRITGVASECPFAFEKTREPRPVTLERTTRADESLDP
jgi:hypothetical protein